MKKMLSSIKATLADDIDSSLVKSSKLAIFTLLESFFSLHEKKKSFNETSWEKKTQFVCLWVKKMNCLRFENIWIWLDEPFEILKSIKEEKIDTKNTFPTFLINLRAPKQFTKKAKMKSQSPHGRWLKIS